MNEWLTINNTICYLNNRSAEIIGDVDVFTYTGANETNGNLNQRTAVYLDPDTMDQAKPQVWDEPNFYSPRKNSWWIPELWTWMKVRFGDEIKSLSTYIPSCENYLAG